MKEDFEVERADVEINNLISKVKVLIFSLKKYFFRALIFSVLGILAGWAYSSYQTINYKAELSFIVEEGKSSAGGFASIAGQLGIDFGGANSSGVSIFSGDNILLFLKSNSLCRETLLTPVNELDSLSDYSLADKYADVYKLKSKWQKSKKVGSLISFPPLPHKNYSRLQDSLLQSIIDRIIKKQLSVDKPEKKATFIYVSVTTKSDEFSKLFCERLVKNAAVRYIQIKTQRQKINVDRLQKRADSTALALNGKTYTTARQQEQLLDINPGNKSTTVMAEVSNRDKLMLGTVYGEVIKNLEISKMALSQETPIIQLVDAPQYPIKNDKIGTLKLMIIFGAITFIIAFFIILSISFFKNNF